MKIKNGAFVVFEFKIVLDTGEELASNESGRPIGFIVGEGHMLPFVEKRLIGMEAGQSASIYLEPEEAFGAYDPNATAEVPRENFPKGEELHPNKSFKAQGPNGPVEFLIKSVGEKFVTVDMNHPLAGRRITCDVKIHEVRELTPEEKARVGQQTFSLKNGIVL